MNLVLIGYRGTGKSEVARHLAGALGLPAVSMDEELVRRAGMRIPDFVARHGWPHFRDLESQVAEELAARDGLIIDTGGGVVERRINVDRLRANGRLYWLKAGVSAIVARIGGDTERPSLTGTKSFTDEVAEVLDRRTPLYAAAAHEAVDTEGRTPTEVAEAILVSWRAGNPAR